MNFQAINALTLNETVVPYYYNVDTVENLSSVSDLVLTGEFYVDTIVNESNLGIVICIGDNIPLGVVTIVVPMYVQDIVVPMYKDIFVLSRE